MNLKPSDFVLDRTHWRRVSDELPLLREGISGFAWLPRVYSLVAQGRIDAAVDLVYDHFDILLHEGRFREVNETLHAIDVQRLDSNLMVAILVITRPATDKLKYRAVFLDIVERTLREQMPERADKVLKGVR